MANGPWRAAAWTSFSPTASRCGLIKRAVDVLIRGLCLLVLATLVPACTQGLLGGGSVLRGGVYVDGPVADATVAALAWQADGSLRLLDKGRSAPRSGEYDIDVGHFTGPLLLQAQGGELDGKLQALVWVPPMGQRQQRMTITPVTHLQAAYARYWLSRGVSIAQAIERSASIFAQQFGGVAHAHVVPTFTGATDPQKAGRLDPARTAGLVGQGLRQLAARHVGVRVGPLLAALAEDVEADGRFDGFGRGGRSLVTGSLSIDGDTTRAAWAEGIIAAAEALPTPQWSRQTVWPLANGLVHSGADLYASIGRDIADAPLGLHLDAELLWCDASGRALVSGTLGRAVRSLWLEVEGIDAVALQALPRDEVDGEQWFAHALPPLTLERDYNGVVVARDRYGIEAVQALHIDCRSDASAHLP